MKEAVTIKNALEKAGFKVVTKQVDKTTFYSEIGQLDNEFDLFAAGWGPDWPAGDAVIFPGRDGSQISEGGVNWAQLNDTGVNKAIAAASVETDPEKANKAWGEIDRQIMELAACVPDYHPIRNYFYESKVGGVGWNAGDTAIALGKVFVKA
ncbi:ABC transporter OS=Streptomyces glaucescens OX=1907 GN=bldKB1 PE=4 SV=1 [Streptomyces glaucescens]